MLILGADPGESNYGYAVVRRGKKMDILEIGQITDTIKNLTHNLQKPKVRHKVKTNKNGTKKPTKWKDELPPLQDVLPLYYNTILSIYADYPDVEETYVERFQTRGVKSKSVETVSMMNGVTATMCMQRETKFHCIIAGTWKNAINKHLDLEELYKFGKSLGFSPHEIDATCIGLTRGGTIPPPPLAKLHKMLRRVHERQQAKLGQ